MRNYLQKYFYHTRSERTGTIVLLALIALSIVFRYIHLNSSNDSNGAYSKQLAEQAQTFFHKEESLLNVTNDESVSLNPFNPNDATKEELIASGVPPRIANILIHYRDKGGVFKTKEDLKKIYGVTPTLFAALESRIIIPAPKQFTNNYLQNYSSETIVSKARFVKNFDPNKVTEEELLAMGLEKRVVKIWLNYRNAGKIFRKKEDVEKIYGITPEFFKEIENFIQLSDNQFITKNLDNSNKLQNAKYSASESNFKIDINTATMEELLRLHGIGHIFASRIIKYREDLGGFVAVNQLKEIENLPDSSFNSIAPLLKLSGTIQQTHINKLNITEIRHPYLTTKQVSILKRYKINHGDLKSLTDMSNLGIFSAQQIDKLKPYLAFD